MAFTYDAAKAATEALHWIRWRIGATKSDASPAVDDEEIKAALAGHALVATSSPVSNRTAVHRAAADACRSLAAGLGRQSGIALTQVGPVKVTAADFYLKLAAQLEATVAAVRADQLEPSEQIDSVDYRISGTGIDQSEYVGDPAP